MKRSGGHERRKYPGLASIAASARRRWWLVFAGMLGGAALATVSSGSADAGYQASSKLLVGPIGGEYSVLRAAGRQAETYVDLATSEPVLRAMRARLRTARIAAQPAAQISVQADDVSRLLTITARAGSPRLAAVSANALAGALQMTTRASGSGVPRALTVVVPAAAPAAPVGTRSKLLVAIAALAGLLGSLTLVVVLDLGGGRVVAEDALVASGAG
jgi:capsular polysaccharide biosynthesis protein